MRVSRRTRPSQVGCGSISVRRRLLHTQTHDPQSRPTPTPPDQVPPSQATMIMIGFVEAWELPGELPPRARVDPQSGHASIGSGSRARGW